MPVRSRVLSMSVLNPAHPGYLADLPVAEQARGIAYAEGVLGTNREYLLHTGAALDDVGLHDGNVDQLCRAVREIRATEDGAMLSTSLGVDSTR
jgi:cation transport regulator ChaC